MEEFRTLCMNKIKIRPQDVPIRAYKTFKQRNHHHPPNLPLLRQIYIISKPINRYPYWGKEKLKITFPVNVM